MRRGSRLARLAAGPLACALALGVAAACFVGCPGRAPRRASGSPVLRRAGAAGSKDSMDDMYVNPDKLISDDQMGMDEDFDEQYLEEPPEELLDEWENDETANEILKQFQDGELEGKDVLKFRDVYKLLAVMGLDHAEFTMMFTESDPDFDDGFDDDPDFDFVSDGEEPYAAQRRGGAGPPGGRFDEDPYGGRYQEQVGAPGGPGGGGRGGGGGGGRGRGR